jgi:hypothetical protein
MWVALCGAFRVAVCLVVGGVVAGTCYFVVGGVLCV